MFYKINNIKKSRDKQINALQLALKKNNSAIIDLLQNALDKTSAP